MEIQIHSDNIFKGIQGIIENARNKVAIFVNAETTFLYWQIGNYINQQLIVENRQDMETKYLRHCRNNCVGNIGQ